MDRIAGPVNQAACNRRHLGPGRLVGDQLALVLDARAMHAAQAGRGRVMGERHVLAQAHDRQGDPPLVELALQLAEPGHHCVVDQGQTSQVRSSSWRTSVLGRKSEPCGTPLMNAMSSSIPMLWTSASSDMESPAGRPGTDLFVVQLRGGNRHGNTGAGAQSVRRIRRHHRPRGVRRENALRDYKSVSRYLNHCSQTSCAKECGGRKITKSLSWGCGSPNRPQPSHNTTRRERQRPGSTETGSHGPFAGGGRPRAGQGDPARP